MLLEFPNDLLSKMAKENYCRDSNLATINIIYAHYDITGSILGPNQTQGQP